MGTTLAALTGKFGNTQYFVLTMKAKDLADRATFRSDESNEWEGMTLEERDQRDIAYTRVKNHIAPYLAQNKDRFLGAIIIAAENFDLNQFEPLEKIVDLSKMPDLYKTETDQMGFLRLTGGEILRPLDGQHRLKAIQFAISGKDEKSQNIPKDILIPDSSLASEEVTVILVKYEKEKARRIFTKVNRYAKKTTTGQNLVTDDDDPIAILSRLIANDVTIIGPDLVNYKTNTLSEKSGCFTTLATIADCNKVIIEAWHGGGDLKRYGDQLLKTQLGKFKQYEKKVVEVWSFLVEHINLFAIALADKEESGNEKRQEIRKDHLLGKPVVQFCLVSAYARLVVRSRMNEKKAAEMLNNIKWKSKDKIWDGLLMAGDRILTKNRAIATDVIYYIAGGKGVDEEELLERYRELFHEDDRKKKKLPPRLS